jgi:hypothetical protein
VDIPRGGLCALPRNTPSGSRQGPRQLCRGVMKRERVAANCRYMHDICGPIARTGHRRRLAASGANLCRGCSPSGRATVRARASITRKWMGPLGGTLDQDLAIQRSAGRGVWLISSALSNTDEGPLTPTCRERVRCRDTEVPQDCCAATWMSGLGHEHACQRPPQHGRRT